MLREVPYIVGFAAVKTSSDAVLSYGLVGRLYLSSSGWILLSVPNAFANGCFKALSEPGAELPTHNGVFNAHISVMTPDEVASIGGPEKITERGKLFRYTLGPTRSVNPEGWDEMDRCWFVEVNSPELSKLRRSYGLSSLPKEDRHKFHITFAVRRKGVLRNNDVTKISEEMVAEQPAYSQQTEQLAALLRAKRLSDQKRYDKKHDILRRLLQRYGNDFVIDSEQGGMYGLTHKPTKFRIHMPKEKVPYDFNRSETTSGGPEEPTGLI